MCGLAGIFAADTRRLDPRSSVARMQEKLIHRGPDDCGMFVSIDQRCALAHTRLSILDLSPAGHQPMKLMESEVGGQKSEVSYQTSQGARYWIVFNGEIYNYRELKRELDSDGLQASQPPSIQANSAWHSNSDTEVILRAYARWGRECVDHFRGMFAFAIYDRGPWTGDRGGELILARDPFGIKPLYYYQSDRLFLFASEVRALLASGLVPRKLSRDGLASYLQFGSVQDPFTMIEGVRSLLPGHFLTVKSSNNSLTYHESEYFSFSQSPISRLVAPNASPLTPYERPKNRAEAVKQLRHMLEDSVRHHLVSDVPLGAFLSGGIDSSAIVALMSRVGDQKPKTFSVIFKEREFSEAIHARLVARKFDTDHREILLSEENLLQMLPAALEAMDQPTMDGINTYVVSKAVKEAGLTVALSGLGGDELFAGYPSFQRAVQLNRLANAPTAIRQFASTTGRAFLNGSSRRQKFWDLVESDCTPYAAYAISRQLFAPSEITALLPDFRPLTSDLRPLTPEPSRLTSDADIVNAVSRYELTGYMSNTLLRDTDQMSMAHALEVRVPFVDPEIVNYVLGLPGEWKMSSGRRPKPLLVDALGDLLPEEIWRRPKMGFTLPFQRWMQSVLESELNATLTETGKLTSTGIDSNAAGSVWHAFKKDPQHEPWSRPWALYVLAKWCDINEVGL